MDAELAELGWLIWDRKVIGVYRGWFGISGRWDGRWEVGGGMDG